MLATLCHLMQCRKDTIDVLWHGHVAGSCSTWVIARSFSLIRCCTDGLLPIHSDMQGSSLGKVPVELHGFPSTPFLQFVHICLDVFTAFSLLATPPSFVSSTNLLRIYSVPPSRSVTKILNRTGHNFNF